MKKNKISVAIITTKEGEQEYMRAYEDYQNRYNAAFHMIMHNIVTYNECGVDITSTASMIPVIMRAYRIDDFNPIDWDIICGELGQRTWARIPSV